MSADLALALLLFAGSGTVVIASGVLLAKYGDALAELMGWGRLWVGTILVAGATSLPELITNVTAVLRDQPELAGGNILGTNMVNMFILAMLALLFGGAHFFRQVVPEQRFLALVAISLTGLAVLIGSFEPGASTLGVGLASLLIVAGYLGGMRLVYATRPQQVQPVGPRHSGKLPGIRKAWLLFGLGSLGVILAAPALAISAERIAEVTGLAASFLGVVAVALVTSLPEASATIAAIRLGATDLAVANLYGSCAFNVLVLAIADPFYRKGVLVETLENAHIATGLVALVLMGLGLSQMLMRGTNRYVPAIPTLILMGVIYLGGLFLVYTLG